MKCPHCHTEGYVKSGLNSVCGSNDGFRSLACIEIERLKSNVNKLEKYVVTADRVFAEACDAMHWPECWDTAAYPTLGSSCREAFVCECQRK